MPNKEDAFIFLVLWLSSLFVVELYKMWLDKVPIKIPEEKKEVRKQGRPRKIMAK